MIIHTVEGPSFNSKDVHGTSAWDDEHCIIVVEGWSPGGVALMNRFYTVAMSHADLLESLRAERKEVMPDAQ